MFEPIDLLKTNVSPFPIIRTPPALHRATVLGAGAWGTALAGALHRSGIATTLWTRRTESADRLNTTHRSDALPGISLPPALKATDDLAAAIRDTQLLIFAVPASATRDLARRLAGTFAPGTLVLSASKGFERETGAFMTQVLDETFERRVLTGALTGPSFAIEVARSEPTTLTLAMAALDPAHPHHRPARRQADALVRALSQAAIRVDTTSDAIGAQIGGALKNQIAIACGMAAALGLGENARAGILTRGLDDMRRLTLALGGRPDTLLGSCGVGDLFLTAASHQSRNTRLGMRLAGGGPATDAERHELAEGAISARTVAILESRLGIHLELAAAVRDVLDGIRSPGQALAGLLEPQAQARTPSRPGAAAAHPPTAAPLPALLRPLQRRQAVTAAMPHARECSHV